jgi:hypothetical protein
LELESRGILIRETHIAHTKGGKKKRERSERGERERERERERFRFILRNWLRSLTICYL